LNSDNDSDEIKKLKSKVWSHFTRLNKEYAKCNHCINILISIKGSTTSGCKRHLQNCHSEIYKKEFLDQKIKENKVITDYF
jgi:uncharacterized protein YdcH (DUF465 family)